MEKANLGLNQLSGIDAELKRRAEKKNRSLENLTQHGNGSESTLKVKRKKLKKQKKSLMSMVEQHDGQVVPASTPGSEPLSERSKKKKKRKLPRLYPYPRLCHHQRQMMSMSSYKKVRNFPKICS